MTNAALQAPTTPASTLPLLTSDWGRVVADLIDLLTDTDGAEFRPSPYAARRLWHLLAEAGSQMTTAFPYGYICGDGAGGVRIEWRRNERELSLQIFGTADKKHYVYHEEADDYGSEDVTDASVLTHWLQWFISQ